MKNLKLTSLLCGGVLSLAGTSLLAQQSSSSGSATSPSSSSSSQTGSSSLGQSSSSLGSSSSTLGSSSSTLGSTSGMQAGNNVRLSQIMNSSVQSQDGKSLGHVRDVVVDPQTGRIEFAILSLSGAGAAADTSTAGQTAPSSRSSSSGVAGSTTSYGTTGKLIPVPWQLFSQSWNGSQASSSSSTTGMAGQHNLVLNMDESKLHSAPSFDASNWNELQGGTLDQRVYSYFGVDRSSGAGTSGSSISGQGASGSSSGQGSTYRGSSSFPHSSSQDSSSGANSSSSSSSGAGSNPK